MGLTDAIYDPTMAYQPPGKPPYTLQGYLTRLPGPLVGSLFCYLQGLPYTFAGKTISITPKIQKICRDCIANAGGPPWPMRTRAQPNIFFVTCNSHRLTVPTNYPSNTAPHPLSLTPAHPRTYTFCHLSYRLPTGMAFPVNITWLTGQTPRTVNPANTTPRALFWLTA